MPLRITSASSRGSKIKNIIFKISSIFVILIVVFTCLVPIISASASKVAYGQNDSAPDTSTNYDSYECTDTFEYKDENGNVLWSYDIAAHNKEHTSITIVADIDDETGACNGIISSYSNDSTTAADVGLLYYNYVTISDDVKQAIANGTKSYSDYNIPRDSITADEQEGLTNEEIDKALTDELSYYDLIIDKSLRLADGASINRIIDLGEDHGFEFKSGTTLKAITSNTDAAFKALMVGAVASSFAGAMNSVTNATEQAELLLTESFSGEWVKDYFGGDIEGRYFVDEDGNWVNIDNFDEQSVNNMIYTVCKDISYSVVLPVAGVILAFVFAWQIYEAVCERNNMADMGTGFFIQMVVRMVIMIMIVLAAWTLTEWVFSLGQWIVRQTSVVVYEDFTSDGMMQTIYSRVTDDYSADDILTWVFAYKICVNDAIDFGNTLVMLVQGLIINIGMYIVSLIVYVIVWVRLIEMYIQCALAPIPLATLANRTWNQTALNFIRSVFALALQGFIIFLCLEIFNVLISNTLENGLSGTDFTGAMWEVIGFALILVFCLFKSSSISKSVVDAR